MKSITQFIRRAVAIAAVAGVLVSSMMVGEVLAQEAGGCPIGQTCGPDKNCYNAGGAMEGPCSTASTPEMSDYLAMAFVLAAGGMIYYFRRQSMASV